MDGAQLGCIGHAIGKAYTSDHIRKVTADDLRNENRR